MDPDRPDQDTRALRTLVLLLPAIRELALAPAGQVAALSMLVGRGREGASAGPGLWPALAGLIDPHPREPGAAALTRRIDAPHDVAGAAWLRADPAHVRLEPVSARLLAVGSLALDAHEVEELLRTLKPVFGDEGMVLDAPSARRWYLRLPQGARLPAFSAPEEALGSDLGLHLPGGDEGRRWRRLFNEVQVILHQHPVNAARAARGRAAVNALWFWGAGALPDRVLGALDELHGLDPVLAAAADLAGIRVEPLDSVNAALQAPRVLLDLRHVRQAEVLESAWIEPARRALHARRIGQLELRWLDGRRHLVLPGDLWRIWRRPRGPWPG